MLLWLALALMTGMVLLFLLRPLWRARAPLRPRAEFDLAIWRDQLAEIDRDVARGVLTSEEAVAARLEIERRVLRSAASPQAEADAGRATLSARIAAFAVIILVPFLSVGLYLTLGAPGLPDEPLAARQNETKLLRADGSLDLVKARQSLEEKLKEHPDSLEGWLLLARADGALEDWGAAHTALDKALELSKRDPSVLESYGELLVGEADGLVTPKAQAMFQEAVGPQRFTSRYYLALGKAQHGDLAGALADWRAIEKDAPPDARWLPNVRSVIAQAEQEQKAGPEPPSAPQSSPASPPAEGAKPPAEMAAIMSLPPEQRLEAIRSMVAGLAARLKDHPDDLEGWKRLARSYRVLGQAGNSADAYGHAASLAPSDASLLADQAQALQQAGRKDEAIAAWQRLLKQIPTGTPDAEHVKQALAALGVPQ